MQYIKLSKLKPIAMLCLIVHISKIISLERIYIAQLSPIFFEYLYTKIIIGIIEMKLVTKNSQCSETLIYDIIFKNTRNPFSMLRFTENKSFLDKCATL